MSTAGITLQLQPSSRIDVIDVNQRISLQLGDWFRSFQKGIYISYHTTAGYFDEALCARLDNNPQAVRNHVESFRRLFPPGAGYSHDRLDLRSELSEQQRRCEPRNADSHLTYIGSGLSNCVTYCNRPGVPVFFVDLDGIVGDTARVRRTSVVLYHREQTLGVRELEIPISGHQVDSVNLKDPRLGLLESLSELVHKFGIVTGRLDLELLPSEQDAGLTVNEYETLLMRHDLAEVLRNPVRFMAEKGRHILADPRAIPGKALNYAKYDLVQIVNRLVDSLGLEKIRIDRILHHFLAVPAERFLRMKRSVSLLIAPGNGGNAPSMVEGTYQAPILVQWKPAEQGIRRLRVRFVSFD